ncbi:MAG: hypothetical protein MUF73_03705 [Rhodobacteraceae bacterium]|nr:hypothetical protein [Paracoccaceae bacterium]
MVTNVVVPTLTVAVGQATPSVGQSLSLITNAAAGAAYQWRRGAADIAGATLATYATIAADGGQILSCRVTSGVQSVTSAGVTVSAAGGIVATFAGSVIASGGAPYALTAPATLLAGQKYVVAINTRGIGGEFDALTLTVNGTTATRRQQAALNDSANQSALFEVVPAASGTDLLVGGTGAATILARSAHIWSVPNAATFQRGAASANTNGLLVRTVSLSVTAGELVIASGGARSLDGLLSMVLEGVTQQGPNRHSNALIAVGGDAGNVAAAAPRTVTLTRGADTGGFTAVAGAWA